MKKLRKILSQLFIVIAYKLDKRVITGEIDAVLDQLQK